MSCHLLSLSVFLFWYVFFFYVVVFFLPPVSCSFSLCPISTQPLPFSSTTLVVFVGWLLSTVGQPVGRFGWYEKGFTGEWQLWWWDTDIEDSWGVVDGWRSCVLAGVADRLEDQKGYVKARSYIFICFGGAWSRLLTQIYSPRRHQINHLQFIDSHQQIFPSSQRSATFCISKRMYSMVWWLSLAAVTLIV